VSPHVVGVLVPHDGIDGSAIAEVVH